MRRLLAVILLTSSLGGCAAVDAYLMAKYDPVEYDYMVKIKTLSDLSVSTCNDFAASKKNADEMYFLNKSLVNFATHIPREQNVQKMAEELLNITQGMSERYKANTSVSQLYCEMKFKSVSSSVESMLIVTGKKPR
jgi:hypothetical protein